MVKRKMETNRKTSLLNFKIGQMKIQQMAFMLIAVTLFFVLVGMFVLVTQYSGLKKEATKLNEENALLLVAKIANSPEFSCGATSGTQKSDCIDEDKVMALKTNINIYKNFWGKGTNIIIRRIYPAQNGEDIQCTTSNYPGCNVINVLGNNISGEHSNFVSLCRKENPMDSSGEVYDKCELGKILVSYTTIS